jgi:hypothetical protein
MEHRLSVNLTLGHGGEENPYESFNTTYGEDIPYGCILQEVQYIKNLIESDNADVFTAARGVFGKEYNPWKLEQTENRLRLTYHLGTIGKYEIVVEKIK